VKRPLVLSHIPLSIGLILCTSSWAWAYSLNDHRQITERALDVVERCTGEPITLDIRSMIVKANVNEDTNLIRKWFVYSHFYHPSERDQAPSSRRANSRARVSVLQTELDSTSPPPGGGLRYSLMLLGYLIHHLQDMTVPPHVVPVNHFWTDGFEKLPIRLELSLPEVDCDSLLTDSIRLDPLELHHQTAIETLNEVNHGELTASIPHDSPIPLSWFWAEVPGAKFGKYGALGNSFGLSSVSSPNGNAIIDRSEYLRYKSHRMASALRVTELLVLRYLQYFRAPTSIEAAR